MEDLENVKEVLLIGAAAPEGGPACVLVTTEEKKTIRVRFDSTDTAESLLLALAHYLGEQRCRLRLISQLPLL